MKGTNNPVVNHWTNAEHALAYLANADAVPHRTEGEAALLELVPRHAQRILDIGTGDGRLLGLLKIDRPHTSAVALDFSPTMLRAARERFAQDPSVAVVEHDLDRPLPNLGHFDAVASTDMNADGRSDVMTVSEGSKRDVGTGNAEDHQRQ